MIYTMYLIVLFEVYIHWVWWFT